MAEQSTHIFGKDGPIVRFDPAQWAQIGTRTVASLGDQGSVAVTGAVDVFPAGVKLLDGWLDLTQATLTVGAAVPANAPVPELYGEGSETTPSSGRFASFAAELGVEAEGKWSDLGPWGVSVAGSLDGKVAYRHLLAVPREDKVTNALLRAVGSAQLPSMVELGKLAVDEHHVLEATLGIGIDAGVEKGFAASIEDPLLEVFGGLPLKLSAQVEGAVRATLGLALHGSMRLAVGRDGETPGFVRIRLERKHQGSFTFGAMIAVQATYDLASSLESILDHALGLLPMPQIEEALGQVEALLGDGDHWNKVRSDLSAAMAERVAVLLGVEGWIDKVAADDEVKARFEQLRAAVKAYRRLDTKVKSWWDHLLVASGFDKKEKIRTLLGTLQKIDPSTTTLADLLDTENHPDLAALLEVVELITGQSLEDLVAGAGVNLPAILTRAKRFAEQAMTVIELPDTVLDRFHDYAKKSGIEGVVAWLETNAGDLQTLKKTANAQIGALLARLIGKAVAEIDDTHLARIQGWAAKVRALLDTRDEWEAKLREKISSLKGTVGFSLAIEVGRLAIETAIIDLDVRLDAKPVLDKVQKALRRVSIDEILAALPGEEEEPGETAELPFVLRECVFLSRRERWFKGGLLLNSFLAKTDRRRITETTVAFTSVKGAIERHVSTSGRFILTQESNLATHFSATAELRLDATDAQRSRFAPCTGPRTPSLRLAVTRTDDKSSAAEVAALVGLVQRLGLEPLGTPAGAVPDSAQTAFALTVGLPKPCVKGLSSLAGDEAAWNRAYLNACARWLGPGFSADDNAPKGDPLPSQVLPALLGAEHFRTNWTHSGPDDLAKWALGKEFTLVFGKKKYRVTPYKVGQGSAYPRWQPPFQPVGSIVAARFWALKALESALKASADKETGSPARMTAACAAFAKAVKVAAPWHWREPVFPVWYLLALVWAASPGTLKDATGMATLRWRRDPTQDWQLATWRSGDKGIAIAFDLFPFKE